MKNRLQQLRKLIDRADNAYYNSSLPLFTDEQYDALKEELIKLAPGDHRNTRFGPPELPQTLQKVKHDCFMGSLLKCDNEDELRKWYHNMISMVPSTQRHKIVVSLKADGGSMAAYYMNGRIHRAVTRGGTDGIGEDITSNAIHFNNLPTQVNNDGNIAVRGEVILPIEQWDKLDADRTSNPRNLGNGIMRRLDGMNSNALSFYAFNVESISTSFSDEIATEWDKFKYLSDNGFTTVDAKLVDNIDEAIEWYNHIAKCRHTIPYWIDGISFKMNDIPLQKIVGIKDNRPRAQVVLKFEPESAETRLIDVVLTVGHTGAIIPTGKVEPVRLGGTTISSVLLNNFNLIKNLDVAIGDKIKIIKAKDIIPQLVQVIERPHNRKVIIEPTTCPICSNKAGRRLLKKQTGTITECKNENCPARSKSRLKTWISKTDIQGIGDELVDSLINIVGIRQPSDLYRMAIDGCQPPLSELPCGAGKLGDKRANAIIGQINNKRHMHLHEFIGSLGIDMLGRRRAKLMIDSSDHALDTIGDWLDRQTILNIAEIANVPNIAIKIADSINAFRDEIIRLLDYIVIEPVSSETDNKLGPLAGMVICFTGKVDRIDKSTNKRYTRELLQKLATEHGASTSADIRADVTHLVQADPESVSSKTQKSQKLGINIISEADFFKLIGM